MSEWRFGQSWSEAEIADRLAALADAPRSAPPCGDGAPDEGWSEYYSEAAIASELPGPASETFGRARQLVENYRFSDPRIVTGHFCVSDPLLGRRMLVEIKVLGLHFMNGVAITAVRSEVTRQETVFGYRYDTLAGHVEKGSEWFLLMKDADTGKIRFRIQAYWQPGDLPTWWTRIGFRLVARRYQRAWHRLSYVRLRAFLGSSGLAPIPSGESILHEGVPLHGPRVARVASAHATLADLTVERDVSSHHHHLSTKGAGS